MRLRDLARNLTLATASALIVVAAAELVLRRFEPQSREFHLWPPRLAVTLHPSPDIMPGIHGESRFTINGAGYRGDDGWIEEGVHRILAVGGSTTECLYLDDTETWAHLLQRDLDADTRPVRVANAGKSGLRVRDHVVQIARLLAQREPVDTVLVMPGVNDFTRRLALDSDWRPAPAPEPAELERVETRVFSVRPAPTPRGLRPEALLGRLARLGAGAPREQEMLRQDERGLRYETWREHRRSASALRTELPDLEPALRDYARHLHLLVDLTRAHGTHLVLATQPALWRPDLDPELQDLLWFGGVGEFMREPGAPYYSVAALAHGMARYNRTLLDVCEARSVECVDLAASVPRTAEMFYDDCHFTEAGARVVATRLASYFRSRPVPALARARGPGADFR